MSTFTPPLKNEIKTKYNISNDDFEILTQDSVPEPSLLKKLGQYLEPVVQLFGVPTFLLKTTTGIIIAIIFIPVWGPPAYQRFQDAKIVAQSYYETVMNTTSRLVEQTPRYAIVIPDNMPLQENPIDLGSGEFPLNSGIYPV